MPLEEIIRTETNDILDGAEFGCRHTLDTHWRIASFHMHPHYEFYLFLQGHTQILIEDERFDAHPGDLFVFPPGMLHRAVLLDYACPYERAYFYVTRKALSEISSADFSLLDLLDHTVRGGNYSYRMDDESANQFLSLIDHFEDQPEPLDPIAPLMNRSRIQMLSLLVSRVMRQQEVLSPRQPERISEVIRYINDHIQEPLSLDSLAERFFISKYTLLHDFKSYANISVHQYILYKRVIYAQHLLRHGVSPGNAAKESGFNDYAGFYRAFVRQNNLTPQAYFQASRAASAL